MIRKADKSDMSEILRIYSAAREFMKSHNNPNQWGNNYPTENVIIASISNGNLYVIESCIISEKLCGCFFLGGGTDPTYTKIYNGAWKSDLPYGAMHIIAGDGSEKGIFRRCFEFSKELYNHLRVDTHEKNKPMQSAIKKCGFEYCGTIYTQDGSPRLAFEWVKN